MREQILRMIRLHNGIREVDLALAVMSLVLPQNFDPDEYHKTLDELVNYGKINRLFYIEPNFATKSMFFTKETKIIFGFDWSASGKMVGESKGDT